MLQRLLPQQSKRRKVAKKILFIFGRRPIDGYSLWRYEQKNEIQLHDLSRLKQKPLISIVVPAYNTPKKYLVPLLRSIEAQTYNNWELILVDASTQAKPSKLISTYAQRDERVKVIKVKNGGISQNTNKGINEAAGKFIGFMDHDDVLASAALYEVALAHNKNPQAKLFYTDEDKVNEKGTVYLDPHFKPDWSPTLLTHVNYITHFTVLEKDLLRNLEGLDSRKDGAQDYDLVLRATTILEPEQVLHIPKVLYHWRQADNSTAQEVANKPYIKTAGVRALRDNYNQRGIKATVSAIENAPGFYNVDYQLKEKNAVVIMPFAKKDLLKKYITVLKKRGLLDVSEVFTPVESGIKNEKVIELLQPADYLKQAFEHIKTKKVVIINDFIIPGSHDWITSLCGVLQEDYLQAVSPISVYHDDGVERVEDAGLVQTSEGFMPLFKGFKYGTNTYFGDTSWPRNVDRLSGRVVAVRVADIKQNLQEGKNLNSFLQKAETNKYYAIWSNIKVEHVKVPLVKNSNTPFFNPNLRVSRARLGLYANQQQILDSLNSLEASKDAQ